MRCALPQGLMVLLVLAGAGALSAGEADPPPLDSKDVEAGRIVLKRPPRVGERLTRLDLDLDLLERVLGPVPGVRHDRRDRLADEAHHLRGEQRPRRAVRVRVLDRRAERPERQLAARDHRVNAVERGLHGRVT